MSTNYYWLARTVTGKVVKSDDPQIHIGLRWGLGEQKFGFAWAQPRADVEAVLVANLDKEVVCDEYDRPFTGAQFMEFLKHVTKEENHIGEYFS